MDERIDRDGDSARVAAFLHERAGLPPVEAEQRGRELMHLLFAMPFLRGARALVDNWWMFLLRGALAVLFGVLVLIQPGPALAALVLVFGVWAFIDGVAALMMSVTGWRSWQLLLAGLVGIAVGLTTFFRPDLTAIGLYGAVAGWAIARGLLEISVAVELRKEIQGEFWMILGGVASIAFGVLLIALPAAGVLAVAWLIGIYALTFGILMLGLAFRLYSVKSQAKVEHRATPPLATPTPA
jgi:uncharacterized membrane protein HdeD (DUF308 family)